MPDRCCLVCGALLPVATGPGRPRVICRAPRCRYVYSRRVRTARAVDRAADRLADPSRAADLRARAAALRAPLPQRPARMRR